MSKRTLLHNKNFSGYQPHQNVKTEDFSTPEDEDRDGPRNAGFLAF
jgi:hypothetical protein